jgi:hypothetical protein
MTGHGYVMRPALAALALALCAGTAQADAIDGQWCNKQGRTLEIDGPKIVTPSGTHMTGDYDRHAFRYVAPAGEAEAGQTVEMTLLGDDDLDLTTGPVAGPRSQPERWRRCQVTS